jgi:hypothetical protein
MHIEYEKMTPDAFFNAFMGAILAEDEDLMATLLYNSPRSLLEGAFMYSMGQCEQTWIDGLDGITEPLNAFRDFLLLDHH